VYVAQRIFPLKRGVFEDKVGTFWYMLDRFVPVKGTYPDEIVAQLCGCMTLLFLLPCTYHLFNRASTLRGQTTILRKTFLLHLFNASMICFLFSYHVHEKTIMLPALAAVLLIPYYSIASVWFLVAASLSLYPLFLEENSHVALLLTTALFSLVAQQGRIFDSITSIWFKLAFVASIGGYVALIFGFHFIKPPANLPHLYQAGIAIYSFLHFAVFTSYFHYLQLGLKYTDLPKSATTTPKAKKEERKKKN